MLAFMPILSFSLRVLFFCCVCVIIIRAHSSNGWQTRDQHYSNNQEWKSIILRALLFICCYIPPGTLFDRIHRMNNNEKIIVRLPLWTGQWTLGSMWLLIYPMISMNTFDCVLYVLYAPNDKSIRLFIIKNVYLWIKKNKNRKSQQQQQQNCDNSTQWLMSLQNITSKYHRATIRAIHLADRVCALAFWIEVSCPYECRLVVCAHNNNIVEWGIYWRWTHEKITRMRRRQRYNFEHCSTHCVCVNVRVRTFHFDFPARR